MRLLASLSLMQLLLLSSTLSRAWETSVLSKGKDAWQAIYDSLGKTPQYSLKKQKNEHTYLTNMALNHLGVGKLFGFGGREYIVTDLNASVFRPYLRKLGTRVPKEASSIFELRLLPPATHFSGIPDFSFALHDWINKNSHCPIGLKAGDPFRHLCYDFAGWMGALNANHFGTQAAKTYLKLHDTARSLARRARKLRELLEKDPRAYEAYRRYLVEAETETAAFEGYAQHFLQDRWSISHMWERWNAAEYADLQHKDLISNIEAAAAAGLLHGTESLTTYPDSLSSPYVERLGFNPITKTKRLSKTGYVVPKWRHHENPDYLEMVGPYDQKLHRGAGDLRLGDMLDGTFGKEYGARMVTAWGKDFPLKVDDQIKRMTRCSAAGWAEVLRDLGTNKKGGYGADRLKLKQGITGFADSAIMNTGCFNMWATNRSMYYGWVDSVPKIASLGRVMLGVVEDAKAIVKNIFSRKAALTKDKKRVFKLGRFGWIKMHWRLWRKQLTKPDGTELARGGIGDLGGIKHGGQLSDVATYIEPKNLDVLPDFANKTGRDKRAFFGFFNRAHADYWCAKADPHLLALRGSRKKVEQAACRYLADRLYHGTDGRYKGPQREVRKHGDGNPIRPICAFYGHTPGQGDDSSLPVTLAPGYVAEGQAQKRSFDGLTYATVARWCDRTPVLRLVAHKERDQDVVAKVADTLGTVRLKGIDLGDSAGKLYIEGGIVISGKLIESWSSNGVVFHLPKDREFEDRDYKVSLETANFRKSVGRFMIRIKRMPPEVVQVKATQRGKVRYDYNQGLSEPIGPGLATLEIVFNHDMDRQTQAEVQLGDTALVIRGVWSSNRRWEGTLVLPGDASFDKIKGIKTLIIAARAATGKQLDGDRDKPGNQPDKKHRLHLRRSDGPAPRLELTGCWGWGMGSTFQLEQKGQALQGALTYYVPGRSKVTVPVKGSYHPPEVRLSHLYTARTIEALSPGMGEMAQALLRAGASRRYRLKVFSSHIPSGTLEGTWMGGQEQPLSHLAQPRLIPFVPGKPARPGPRWTATPSARWLPSPCLMRRDGRFYEFSELQVTGADYRKTLKVVAAGEPFWVRARAREGCPVAAERLELSLSPVARPGTIRWLTLVETGKDSREYRSPPGGWLLSLPVDPGQSMRLRLFAPSRPELQPVIFTMTGRSGAGRRGSAARAAPSPVFAAAVNPVISLYNAQLRCRLELSLHELRALRRQAARKRRGAFKGGKDSRTARALAEAVEKLEQFLMAFEKRIGPGILKELQKPGETRRQWLHRLLQEAADFDKSARASREHAARAKDATERMIAGRMARQSESIARQLRGQVRLIRNSVRPMVTMATPGTVPPQTRAGKAPMGLAEQAFTRAWKGSLTRIRQVIAKDRLKLGKLKLKSAKGRAASDYNSRIRQLEGRVNRATRRYDLLLDLARKTFKARRYNIPSWMQRELRRTGITSP